MRENAINKRMEEFTNGDINELAIRWLNEYLPGPDHHLFNVMNDAFFSIETNKQNIRRVEYDHITRHFAGGYYNMRYIDYTDMK